jgi:hypothetical protein
LYLISAVLRTNQEGNLPSRGGAVGDGVDGSKALLGKPERQNVLVYLGLVFVPYWYSAYLGNLRNLPSQNTNHYLCFAFGLS